MRDREKETERRRDRMGERKKKSQLVLITAMHLSEWHLELKGTTCS